MKTLLSKFLIYMLFPLALTVSAHSIGLPKIGGNSGSGGGNVDELKLKFTKVFFWVFFRIYGSSSVFIWCIRYEWWS